MTKSQYIEWINKFLLKMDYDTVKWAYILIQRAFIECEVKQWKQSNKYQRTTL